MQSTMTKRYRRHCLLLVLVFHLSHGTQFEPYQLNGGLVAAVAGKDYVVIASDTRLSDGGYEIYTRRHLTSRLWSTLLGQETQLCEPDRSLSLPETTEKAELDKASCELSAPPVWIASSGCAADCEALKRHVRMEVKASRYWNTQLSIRQVSCLLSQVLYRRRSFPYYSFCVVAGLSEEQGAAYVYDAIGSFEQVAVATTGTGRELLQPILDRLFIGESEEQEEIPIDRQQSVTLSMPRVVSTCVGCSADQAVSRLVAGYKSVAERDIGVGDSVVLCITQRNKDGRTFCRVISVPLKTH